MKILLQHVRTRLYLRSLDGWTANPYEACDFQHSMHAIEFAEKHQLQEVQLVVRFPDEECVTVPLPVRFAALETA